MNTVVKNAGPHPVIKRAMQARIRMNDGSWVMADMTAAVIQLDRWTVNTVAFDDDGTRHLQFKTVLARTRAEALVRLGLTPRQVLRIYVNEPQRTITIQTQQPENENG